MAPSAVSEAQATATPVVAKPVAGGPSKGTRAKEDETPLQAISQGEVMPGIPTFPTFVEERRHTLIHMAATFRAWARQGFVEGQSGHISVRDPEFPGLMWMNPLGRHYGMLRAGDMLALDIASGRIVAGKPNPSTGKVTGNAAGYYIHAAVHRVRPDIHAACHAHTMAGRAWSVFGRPLDMLTQDVCSLHNAHSVYTSYGGIVFAEDEANNIAAALGTTNKALIMINHGLLTVGTTVDEAGWMFGLLERSCAIQLKVEATGLPKNIIADEEAAHAFKMASEENALYREAQPDIELEIEAAGGEEALARGYEQLVVDPEITIA
ncbi:class II Aldolase [Pyricularia oryzae 70-15]|uniref:Class II Aldolase n=3 Tax=Pyricularia oryzae TaxID=318829 RepID=G4MKN5_PYRO7|nr:class II Aldolase [Pyricularia oryzae 70-15]EHA56725.1 class II Aldolase [Pyricularia oryzae 70-15]ELQ41442.1 Class II Aldolase family protein [Pyricularia oryzae Y34]KAI7912382.1 class II Aldolase [Pyricularia oryzae]KAI7930147.1 class II Aldolase [Pyricularia oryzae]